MDAAPSRQENELAPVKFARLSKRGLLLGMSVPQVISVAIALLTMITALYTAGTAGLLLTSPLWCAAVAVAWVPVGGRKLVEWIPVSLHWTVRTAARQVVYRRRIVKPRPAGTLALPGDSAALRQLDDPDSGAVLVHDPHGHTLVAVTQVTHPSFPLLDTGDQQRRITGWSRVLATACRSGRIKYLQVLARTLPDSGAGLAQWWADHGINDGSWVARTYAELIERAGPAGERHVTTVSIGLDMRAAARAIRVAGGGRRGAAHVMRQEMRTLMTALRSAELRPTAWYAPAQLAVTLRGAYDPDVIPALERNGDLGHDLASAGPVAVEESWDMLRSDSAFHAVLWVSEWPRSQVHPGFLSPVLLSSGIRQSLSLVFHPLRADRARRNIRRAKVQYISDSRQRAKLGQIDDAQQNAELADVLQQEADLTAGHGLLRCTGLLAVSAPSRDELEAAVAEVEQNALQASCETRRIRGQQAQAFAAAALPLCRPV